MFGIEIHIIRVIPAPFGIVFFNNKMSNIVDVYLAKESHLVRSFHIAISKLLDFSCELVVELILSVYKYKIFLSEKNKINLEWINLVPAREMRPRELLKSSFFSFGRAGC